LMSLVEQLDQLHANSGQSKASSIQYGLVGYGNSLSYPKQSNMYTINSAPLVTKFHSLLPLEIF